MNVIPFLEQHFYGMEIQPAQEYARQFADSVAIKGLEGKDSYSIEHEGKVICCFGWVNVYEHRAMIWGLFAKDSGPHFTAFTKIAKRLFDGLPHKRLELEVDYEFDQGHRWARMLGFEMETGRLRGFRIDGGDSALYSRIR